MYPAAEDLYATSVLKIYAKIRFFKLISTKLHSPFDVLIDVLNTFCTSKLRRQRMIQLPFISLFMYLRMLIIHSSDRDKLQTTVLNEKWIHHWTLGANVRQIILKLTFCLRTF